ncbi:hypothetical protein [Mucilaginibacter aquaedulcis]|uniref:hypothetical protein n=1 Tax=Mucilaginibacter aquaedulcis TaxID=1187081 RepID=UPI0025B5BF35|nr:hypothetical protein [Mucilaginibacter aquaedulcis]MDN3550210.1 hypothetical protein [Mucilaginibacter aquaedulcis]
MITIRMKEPESGMIQKLQVEPVRNLSFPGWVVLIPGKKNVLIFWKDNKWHVIPESISYFYAEKIGNKLRAQSLKIHPNSKKFSP